jgi:hypothetical protein
LPLGSTTTSAMAAARDASTAFGSAGRHAEPCLSCQRLRRRHDVACENRGSAGGIERVVTKLHGDWLSGHRSPLSHLRKDHRFATLDPIGVLLLEHGTNASACATVLFLQARGSTLPHPAAAPVGRGHPARSRPRAP